MYAVGRLGSYITRGVYTVSGPFHPFGGAVDIIVVEQQDGSFKSSPWYVRFGKFQGVLKTKEKMINISVNGVEADFHMYLDHKGEAYFLREEENGEEEGDSILYPSSSGEETDGQSRDRIPMKPISCNFDAGGLSNLPLKSKSCNFDANQSNLVTQIDVTNGKIFTRTNSSKNRILGLVFGRKSKKEDSSASRVDEDGPDVVRADSLERAEIAADLLEMKWSTNLASNRHRKDNASLVIISESSECEANKELPISYGQVEMGSPSIILDPTALHAGIVIHDNGISISSDKDFGKLSCLNTEHNIGTSSQGESGLQEKNDLNFQTSREIDEIGVTSADHDKNAMALISETISSDLKSAKLDECPGKKLEEEHIFKEGIDRLESLVYSKALDSSRLELDDSGGQTDETLYVSCGGGAEVCVHAKMVHETAELLSEVNSVQETSLLVAKDPLDFPSNSYANSTLTKTYAQMVTVDPIDGSVKEVESCSIYTISGFNNSIYEVQDGENTGDEDNMTKLQYSSETVGDSQEFRTDSFSTEAKTLTTSEGSEEEKLLGDLDDFNHGKVRCMESNISNHVEKQNHPSDTSKGSEAVIESLNPNDDPHSSSNKFVQENTPNDVEDFSAKPTIVSSSINIPKSNKVAGEDLGRAESLPNMWSHTNDLIVDDRCSFGHSLDSKCKSSTWTPLGEDISSWKKSDANKDDQVSLAQPTVEDAQILEELKNGPASPAAGDPSKVTNDSNGSWGVWPFSFKRSRSMKATQPAQNSSRSSNAESTLESSISMDGEKDMLKPKVKNKKSRGLTPTPEQLASLNLKHGQNTVTFTFSTPMLGPQQVDARIYLWKWDSRIVISDVDGTITKSDVLGQFMPLVGMDWSQTGVAHLYSAIKENGYHLLFLSARAISQAYHTRQFLFNLKQDGKALPEGPVVISPDGLFPSLFREVIRRAPHEFKIACLEDIKALFPADCHPFYAGFGNRDTDEFSYLKVGIPKGKIFIINPKGEVAVHRRVDTKSYTSLHGLVHDMFPPMTSSEQEDYNSWNYWRLPPALDI
ncbi:hypothetical protein CsSME_00013247 [Camellia sinensis var. sinensis]